MRTMMSVFCMILVVSGASALSDCSVTWHTHPREFSKWYDGQMTGKNIVETCGTNAVVITAHLDIVAQKGVENYLQFIRDLNGSVIVIPGVEVTADSTESRNDVIIVGITKPRLQSLSSTTVTARSSTLRLLSPFSRSLLANMGWCL